MIAGSEWDFEWNDKQLEHFLQLWNENMPEYKIARELKRTTREIEVLKLDLSEKQQLPKRNAAIKRTPVPRPLTLNPMNTEAIKILYRHSRMTTVDIGIALGIDRPIVDRFIFRERKKNPELWPLRKKHSSKNDEIPLEIPDKNQLVIEELLVK